MPFALSRTLLLRTYCLITFVNLFVILFSRGPIEGDARNLEQHVKGSDWYGPMPPLLYGRWPISGENWDLTLTLLQVLFFCFGFFLLINLSAPFFSPFETFLQLSTYWVGMLFCSQLWRDASLLALVILGFGIIKFALRSQIPFKLLYFSIAFVLIIFGASFKFIYAPIISFLLVLYISREIRLDRKVSAALVILLLSTSITPFLVDRSLSNWLSLKKTFPEQQPVIFDLASIYCWGTSLESNDRAIKGLRVLKKPNYPDPSICSSLEPTGWDTLRTDRPLWEYSSPLSPLTSEKDVRVLIENWLEMIILHPQEYLEVKIIHSTQVLSMANALGPRLARNFSFVTEKSIFYEFVEILTLPPRLLDKLRIFSLALLIMIISITLMRFTHASGMPLHEALKKERELFLLLFCIVCQVGLTTLSFVSSNGRYSLPFVVLELILFLDILDRRRTFDDSKKEFTF